MRVVAVTIEHQVYVHVPEAWEHAHAIRRDHLRTARHRQCADSPDGTNAFAFNEDDAVSERTAAKAIDERATDQRLDGSCL